MYPWSHMDVTLLKFIMTSSWQSSFYMKSQMLVHSLWLLKSSSCFLKFRRKSTKNGLDKLKELNFRPSHFLLLLFHHFHCMPLLALNHLKISRICCTFSNQPQQHQPFEIVTSLIQIFISILVPIKWLTPNQMQIF